MMKGYQIGSVLPVCLWVSGLFLASPSPVLAQGNAADCYEYVTSYGANQKTAMAICQSYPQYAGICAQKIRDLGGTWATAEAICKYGTAYSADCVASVQDLGANWQHSQEICGNAMANTSQCVQEARDENFSWDNTVNECRRPAIADGLQNCMNGLMYGSNGRPTGVTAVAAEQECRGGRP